MGTGGLEIFVDESGDLGIHAKSPRHYVIAYVIPNEPARVRTEVSGLVRRLARYDHLNLPEFRHSLDSTYIRNLMFRLISTLEFEAGITVIEKVHIWNRLKNDYIELYNHLIADSVANQVLRRDVDKVNLTLDYSLSNDAIVQFNDYFARRIGHLGYGRLYFVPHINVKHADSRKEACLQVADYVAGAAFKKYERQDSSEYDLIKNKVTQNLDWEDIKW
jgi:hypothetical protein